MTGKLSVVADRAYYFHIGATGQGTPLIAPIDVTLSQ
jgi:hypothetical protein